MNHTRPISAKNGHYDHELGLYNIIEWPVIESMAWEESGTQMIFKVTTNGSKVLNQYIKLIKLKTWTFLCNL